MSEAERRELAKLRTARAKQQRALAAAAEQERQSARQLAELKAKGATAAQVKVAERRLDTATAKLSVARDDLELSAVSIKDKRAALDRALRTPDAAVKTLSAKVPVLMAPVRIETRFFPGELRIRIFPDVFHIDTHEEALTAKEQAQGQEYWKQRWDLRDPDAIADLWARTTAEMSPWRAAWVAEATTPTNIERLGRDAPEFGSVAARPPGPSSAPVARSLPTRWLITALRDDTTVARKWGTVIPDNLPVGPAPELDIDDNDHTEVPDQQDELPEDEALAWLTDFDEAVKRGMALTITDADVSGSGVGQGFDQIIAIGVDWTRDPDQSDADLQHLLSAHAHTRGLSFIPTGTATNATAESLPPAPVPASDPSVEVAPAADTAAGTFATSVGGDSGLLSRLAGADAQPSRYSGPMHTALWEPTVGYFLRQFMTPVIDEATIENTRSHFINWVRPRGAMPHLRVGRQPYGIVAVMAPTGYTGDAYEQGLHQLLTRMRPFWTYSADGKKRLGQSGDPSEDLIDLLGRNERSQAVRIRQAVGSSVAATIAGYDTSVMLQSAIAMSILSYLGAEQRPPMVDVVVNPQQKVLPIALVQPQALSETEPLHTNYIQAIRGVLGRRGSIDPLKEQADTATSLLQALLAHGATIELSRAALMMVLETVDHRAVLEHVGRYMIADEILIRDDNGARVNSVLAGAQPVEMSQVETLLQQPPLGMLESKLPDGATNLSIADQLRDFTEVELSDRVFGLHLSQFRQALTALETAPTAELQRLGAETLDSVSHRIDAWFTSLASKRLADMRSDQPSGVHMGGFGWVENVSPRNDTTSAGYVHAPSVSHATTAAILRSGHLSHGEAGVDGDADWLAVDLSSKRVRTAMDLLDGVRAGQPVGALLGYRFERGLRDLGFDFAKYIYDIRREFPIDEWSDRSDGAPAEAVPARDVVDGAALAELDPGEVIGMLTGLGVAPAHRQPIRNLISQLADTLDAAGDLLVAESVHQAVLGNTERSAAALDALDRQVSIPEIGIVNTPRTGRGLTHRVVAMLRGSPAAGWPADTRSSLAPELNQWIGRALGEPDRYQFTLEGLDESGAMVQSITVALASLGLSPLSAVLATRRSNEEATELEQRLNVAVASQLAPEVVALRPAVPTDRDIIDFAQFGWRATRIVEFVAGGRSATASDFVTADQFTTTDPGIDVSAAASRAAAAASALDDALTRHLAVNESSSIATLRATLSRAADLGLRGAIAIGDKPELHAQVEALTPQLEHMAAAIAEVGLDVDPDPRKEADRCHAVLTAVLGADVPIVFPIKLPAAVVAALGDSSVDEPMARVRPVDLPDFLFQHSLVRSEVGRFQAVLDDAEALDLSDSSLLGTSQLAVAQLPYVPDDAWIASPLPIPGQYPVGQLSMVIHDPDLAPDGRLELGGRLSALVVDQWNEHIPHPSETTGVGFHFDAPGARPPQSMVMAVPANQNQGNWSAEQLVDTVRETLALSKLRMLDLDDIGAAPILPATYVPFSLERQAWSLDFSIFLPLAYNAVLLAQQEEGGQ